MGIRRVVTRSGLTHRFKVPSVKLGRTVYAESQLEQDFLLLLDQAAEVITYAVQPALLEVLVGSSVLRHTPDVLVRWHPGLDFAEVKQSDRVDTDVIARSRAFTRALEPHGIGYCLFTDQEIRTEPFLSRARLLRRYRSHPVSADAERHLLDFVQAHPGCAICELPWARRAEAFALIARCRLRTDPAKPLTLRSPLFVMEVDDGQLRLLSASARRF